MLDVKQPKEDQWRVWLGMRSSGSRTEINNAFRFTPI